MYRGAIDKKEGRGFAAGSTSTPVLVARQNKIARIYEVKPQLSSNLPNRHPKTVLLGFLWFLNI
jgi:hypothetical protein